MSTPIVLVPLPHDALARRAAAWWNGARGAPEEGAEHLTVGARDGSARADVRVDRAGRFWRGDAPLSPPTSQPPEPLAALAPLIVHVLRGPGAPDDDAWFDALVAPADDVGEPGPDLTIRVYEVTDGPMPDALSRALAAPVDASDDDWRLDAGRSLVLLAKVGSPAWLGEIRDRVGHDRVITLAGRDLARAGRDAALRHVLRLDGRGDRLPIAVLSDAASELASRRASELRGAMARRPFTPDDAGEALIWLRTGTPPHATRRAIEGALRRGQPLIIRDLVARHRPSLLEGQATRIAGSPAGVLDRVATIWLRAWSARAHVDAVRGTLALPTQVRVLATPPAALRPAGDSPDTHEVVVHPDPPMSPADAEILGATRPDLRVLTTTTALAWGADPRGDAGAPDRPIALSTSEVVATRPGQHDRHLLAFVLGVLRAVVAAGATVRYDGALGALTTPGNPGGPKATIQFTHTIGRAMVAWGREYRDDEQALHCEVAPDNTNAGALRGVAITTSAHADLDARRRDQARRCGARLVVGGKERSDPPPGIIVELVASLDAQADNPHPIYVLGGLGGAAAIAAGLIAAGMDGAPRPPNSLPAPMVDTLVAYGERLGRAQPASPDGNGLDPDENQRLLRATDPVEAGALVLRGLRAWTAARAAPHLGRDLVLLDAGVLAATTAAAWLIRDPGGRLCELLQAPSAAGSGLTCAGPRFNRRPVLYYEDDAGLPGALAELAALRPRSLAFDAEVWDDLVRCDRLDAIADTPELIVACSDRGALARAEPETRAYAAQSGRAFTTQHPPAQAREIHVTLDAGTLSEIEGGRALAVQRSVSALPRIDARGDHPDSGALWLLGEETARALGLGPRVWRTTQQAIVFTHGPDLGAAPFEATRPSRVPPEPLPWPTPIELLRDRHRPDGLALIRPVVRHLRGRADPIDDPTRRKDGRLNLLIMALPVDPVLRHADAAAAQLAAQGDELARMAEASRLDVRIQRYRHGHSPPLLELLREPWDIVHIATHGDAAGQLLLPDNSLAVADDGAVRHGSAHGLVVINACWGVSVANPNTLADLYVKLGCAALVGPTLPVVSEAAALFSRVLYRRWFAGDALEIAVLAARTALAQSDLQPAWPLYVQYGGLGLTANGLAGV